MPDTAFATTPSEIMSSCCSRWRYWIRPFVICLYVTIIVVVLPVLIIHMLNNKYEIKIEVWLIGGIFTFMAVPISIWDITQHLVYYTKPHLQKYIIRILWMVPIYALNAWLGLTYPKYAIYMDTCRECYEAYVIYNFMMFLLTFLRDEMDIENQTIMENRYITHIFPLCFLKPWPLGRNLIHRCKHGILQYTVIRPCTTVIALITEMTGVYKEGEFKGDASYPYIVAINNVSQFVAMYCLVLFYRAHREELQPMKPIGKFLCIKAVVFFSFFQGVIIAILVFTGVLTTAFPDGGDPDKKPQQIQNFLICIEMFLAALAHHYSFSYQPYVDLAQEHFGCCYAFLHMWDVSDVRHDFAEHINVIQNTVRRTVKRSHINQNTRKRVSEKVEEEKQSLLQAIAGDHTLGISSGRSYQAMSDSDHEGISAGITALKEDQISIQTSNVQVYASDCHDGAGDFIDLTSDAPVV